MRPIIFFGNIQKTVTVLILLLNADLCPAQLIIGFNAGISTNHLQTDITNRPSTVLNSSPGYSFSLPVLYRIKNWLYASVSPGLIQKNYTMARTGALQGIYATYKNNYLQLPIAVHIVYGKKIRFFSEGGIYGAYWYSGRIKGKIPDIFSATDSANTATLPTESFRLTAYDQKYTFNTKRDQQFEFGWALSAGIEYKIGAHCTTFLQCTAYRSLTDHQKHYSIHQIPQYNETLVFTAGGRYYIK